MKKMLLVFAHPDDESFFCGGTVAKYAKLGWEIHAICLTRGERGKTGSYGSVGKDELATIRSKEFGLAAGFLGVRNFEILNLPDGDLSSLTPGTLEDVIWAKMISLSPDIVITFNSSGISNHPDHIKTCYAATYAFQRYMGEIEEARQFVKDANTPGKVVKKRHFQIKHKLALSQQSFAGIVEESVMPKLYYVCIPAKVILFLQRLHLLAPDNHGKPIVGTPDKFITTVIDVRRHKKQKLQAILAHESQISSIKVRISKAVLTNLFAREYFVLRYYGPSEIFLGKNDQISDHL